MNIGAPPRGNLSFMLRSKHSILRHSLLCTEEERITNIPETRSFETWHVPSARSTESLPKRESLLSLEKLSNSCEICSHPRGTFYVLLLRYGEQGQPKRIVIGTHWSPSKRFRFLKRDGETGAWVDVGDDIAREKASQVLRDAVALLQEGALFPGNTTEPTPEDGGTSPQADDCQDETPSAKQLAREPNPERNPSHHDSGIDSMITPHHTPSLIDSVNTSASFPPPRPLEISRKRHRQNLSDDDQLLIHTAQGDEWLISQGVDEWSQSPSQRRRSNPDHGFIQEASKGPRWYSDSRYETPNACSSATLRSRDMNSSRTYSGSSPLRPRDDPPQYRNPSQYHRTADGYMVLPSSAYHPHPHSIHRRPVPIPEYSSPPPLHVAHPQHQRHKASTNSHNLGWKQPNRPQSIAAARQASTASCGSLFGEVGNNLGFTDFDLFNWELLDDGNGNNEMQPKKGTSASASPR